MSEGSQHEQNIREGIKKRMAERETNIHRISEELSMNYSLTHRTVNRKVSFIPATLERILDALGLELTVKEKDA